MVHDLRRSDLEIADPAEVDRILAAAKFATVALVDGDRPYVITMSCGYDPELSRLCFHVARTGRKLDVIARNSHACATVVGDLGYRAGECAHPYESVVMMGRMRVVDDPADARVAMRTLMAQLETSDHATAIWERNALDTAEGLGRCRILVFEIDDLTAKTGQ